MMRLTLHTQRVAAFQSLLSSSMHTTPSPSPLASSSFLFTTCQAGVEKLIKEEFKRNHPSLRFAFSRPGLVTFKNPPDSPAFSPSVSIRSSFSRVHGISIGSASTAVEIISTARRLNLPCPICLHVWYRDRSHIHSSSHPLAVLERAAAVVALRSEILSLDDSRPPGLWSASAVPDEGEPVLSVILGDDGERHFLGLHTHASFEPAVSLPGRLPPGGGGSSSGSSSPPLLLLRRSHVPHAGGVFPGLSVAPPAAPSRAYLKLEEALSWAGLSVDLRPGDAALEVGSAPGGAAYALLERGLTVFGVDPEPRGREHAPVVKDHPRFTAFKARLGQAGLRERLPKQVDWLLCDANISPDEAVPHLADLCEQFSEKLKGILYTCKLGERLFSKPVLLLDELDKVKARLAAKAEFVSFECVQLSANKQELLILGLTRRGARAISAERPPV